MKAKAAVVEKRGEPWVIKEVDIAEPIGAEVLVETTGSGLCASDLHVAEDDYGFPFPTVLGHELAGVVKEVGPDVTEFKVGDRVVGSLIQYCGSCTECLRGHLTLCTNRAATLRSKEQPPRISRDGEPISQGWGLGAFAEYALVHQNQLARLDVDVPAAQAAILGCGVVTGAGAVINTAAVRPGDTVAVFGAGGVGLNALSGARIAGASRIIAVDLSDEKLELAKRFGATDVVNGGEGDPVERIQELTGGGVDAAFEVIGLGVTQHQAIKSLVRGGCAYFIGMTPPGRTLPVDTQMELLTRSAGLRGVYMGSSNIKHDIPMYAALYKDGRMNLDDLVSQEIPLDDINAGYDKLKAGAVARSVITSF